MTPRRARDKMVRRPLATDAAEARAEAPEPQRPTRYVLYTNPETGRGIYVPEPCPDATSES